ncbi:b(0,+)-type amino acid transporter 1-like [Lytechinus variegatus]|uniref:b(0,+)-type amino acid transporter 1-like n=1 Tax=Lytechinus variegatus TaxID=7654 RepID=UPI001BB23865|nr:b(0,+)-type amino acid transporter 1-like [Lytechinus variegatus]
MEVGDKNRHRTGTILSVLSAKLKRKNRGQVTLSRRLGLGSNVSLLIGIMIGTGIFVAPRGVLRYTGSFGASLLVWFLCGLIAMIGSLIFSELALMFPKSGGDHTYLQETYGDVLAFLHGWGAVLVVRPITLAIVSIVLGEYIIYPYFDDLCYRDETMVKLHAATFIIVMMLVHGSGLKLISKLQVVFTSIKVVTLLLIIIDGMINISMGYTDYLDVNTSFEGTNKNAFAFGMAFYQGMFAYEGWNSLTFTMEEMKDPAKTLPRAIMIAMPTITVLYILVNISYYTVLSPQQVLMDEAIATTFSSFTLHGKGILQRCLPFLVCCAAVGTANGLCYTYSRMAVALGREGHMPQIVGMVNPDTMSPNFALFLMGLMSIITLLIPVSLEHLIEFFSFAIWLSYFFISIAVLILRYTKPDLHRPFKVHWSLPVLMAILSVFLIIAPFFEAHGVNEVIAATVIIVAGLIVYVPFIYYKYQPPFMDKITIFVQLFLCIVNTEYKPPEDFPIDEDDHHNSKSHNHC